MRQSEARHLSRVAELGCALCRRLGYGETPAQIHHLRMDGSVGLQQRERHWTAIPLCERHHQQPHGIHGDRQDFRNAKCNELDLLADVLEAIYG